MRGAVNGFSVLPCLSCHLQPCFPSGSPEVALDHPVGGPRPLFPWPLHNALWQEALWGPITVERSSCLRDPGHILHCPAPALQEEGRFGQELPWGMCSMPPRLCCCLIS